jgi:hypothetical protein
MKKLLFMMIAVACFTVVSAQIKSDKWPPASIEYNKQPRLMVTLEPFIPDLGPLLNISWGAYGDFKLNDKIYLNGSFYSSYLDEDNSNSTKQISAGGEYIYKIKEKYHSTRIVISSNTTYHGNSKTVETKYREYDVLYPTEKALRFGMFTYNQLDPAFRSISFYAGFAKKTQEHYTIKMSDYVEPDDFKLTWRTYFDVTFSAYNKVLWANADPDDYKMLPFGIRGGFEMFKATRKYTGRIVRVEVGSLPGLLQLPVYFKMSIGWTIFAL